MQNFFWIIRLIWICTTVHAKSCVPLKLVSHLNARNVLPDPPRVLVPHDLLKKEGPQGIHLRSGQFKSGLFMMSVLVKKRLFFKDRFWVYVKFPYYRLADWGTYIWQNVSKVSNDVKNRRHAQKKLMLIYDKKILQQRSFPVKSIYWFKYKRKL